MEQSNTKTQRETSSVAGPEWGLCVCAHVSMQVSEHVCVRGKSVQARMLPLINYAFINRRPEKTKFQTAERCSGLVKQLNGAAQLKPNFFFSSTPASLL